MASFAKSKKHVPETNNAYSRLTKQASKLVKEGGLYVACSCSRNLEDQEFLEIVLKSLVGDGWVFLEKSNQSPDHIISAFDSISEYLKCMYFRKRKLGKNLGHENS